MLRIGIDGYNMAMAKGTGVATYARTLARCVNDLGYALDLLYGLPVSPKARSEVRETLFFARLGDDEIAQNLPFTIRRFLIRTFMMPTVRDLIRVPVEGRVFQHDFGLRVPPFDRLFTRGGIFSVSARYFTRFGRFMPLRVPDPPDIMHWTYPLPLRLVGARNVYTLHDLVPLRLPHTSLEDKRYYDRLIAGCVASAAHIVTVSESSRSDIEQLFPGSADKMTNTYQPVDVPEEQHDSDLAERLERLFDVKKGEYFLFFGAIEPKKNVGRLIEAYLMANVDRPLLIVGSDAWRSDRELRLLRNGHGVDLAGTRAIRRIDYLPRDLLLTLAAGARAVLFPSLYEGFGLPAAESLALGVPVLASSEGALPEVVGEGGLIVDPYDTRALAAALCRLDSDDALISTLSDAGRRHVRRFAAERYRETMSGLYERLMATTQPDHS